MTKGFTLVELSIVLVIIGLLVGGIMIGKSLIGSSEIRAQISQIETFKTAANSFKLKYGALPGDISPVQTAQLGFLLLREFTQANPTCCLTVWQTVT